MQHRIRKLQDSMSINDASENTVQTVIERLLPLYKEYQLERKDLLQATVKEALLVLTKAGVPPKPPVTLSLNQSMQNQYNKSGSKRSRPEDLEVTDTEADLSKIEKEPVVAPTAKDAPAAKASSTPKKKKAVSFRSDETEGVAPNGIQVILASRCPARYMSHSA